MRSRARAWTRSPRALTHLARRDLARAWLHVDLDVLDQARARGLSLDLVTSAAEVER